MLLSNAPYGSKGRRRGLADEVFKETGIGY